MAQVLRVAVLGASFLAGAAADTEQSKKPHLIMMLADDLGWHDTSIYGDQSPEMRHATHNLTQLANEGIRLAHHYVHWHCSPTRRSFLTGRTPLHHGEHLSNVQEDYIDLRWTWISDKLKKAGYSNHWYGKGHTGYKSMAHLPISHHFDDSLLYLGGAGSYYTLVRWNNSAPYYTFKTDPDTYSTDLFGSMAVKAIESHDPSTPFFLYLPWQAVHAPYDVPPYCKAQGGTEECPVLIRSMIHDVDIWTGRIIDALKAKGMYRNTLMVFTSDNGGTQDPPDSKTVVGGNNYPLRGAKHSNWQGGMRTSTFVSGGLIPERLRGTTNNGSYHIVDWYPTFCALAGIDGSDDSPEKPLPVDPSQPEKDIYGRRSWPSVDGVNIWDEITAGAKASRSYLWLSAEVLIKDTQSNGGYKLVVAQQDPSLTNSPPMTGWRQPDGSWVSGGELDGQGCGVAFKERGQFKPCLFDLTTDQREQHDLSTQMPELLQEMWAELNRTDLTAYLSRSPANLLGPCNEECADKHWTTVYGKKVQGPICGVPGCGKGVSVVV